LRDVEEYLRDSGAFSKSEAIAFASRVSAIARRDAAREDSEKDAALALYRFAARMRA
jgi:hypothetical protein